MPVKDGGFFMSTLILFPTGTIVVTRDILVSNLKSGLLMVSCLSSV
jgi:hypothetical protein